MGVLGEEKGLRRLVLVSGTTGTDIGSLLEVARGDPLIVEALGSPECVVKFEDFIEEESLGPCGEMFQLVRLLQISRPAAVDSFRRAAERLSAYLRERGCRGAVVGVHLSYLSRDYPTRNPVIHEFPRLLGLSDGAEVHVVHVSEDWYDILASIALRVLERDRCSPVLPPYKLDHISLLYWRGFDMDMASLIQDYVENGRSYIYAVKHSRETTRRFLEHLAGARRHHLVYVSHPITAVRRVYSTLSCMEAMGRARVRGEPLGIPDIPFTRMIEAYKNVYRRRHPDVVLFEPTTIDEHVVDVIKPSSGDCSPLCGQLVFSQVDRRNRWPLPRDPTRGMHVYRERERRGLFPLLTVANAGEGLLDTLLHEVYENLCVWGESGGRAWNQVISKLQSIITSHIEIRDYKYVEQSKYVLVLMPLVYERKDSIVEAWLLESSGVDREIQRATALARPVYYVLLPVNKAVLMGVVRERYDGVGEDDVDAILEAVKAPGEPCRFESPGGDDLRRRLGECIASGASTPFRGLPPSARVLAASPVEGMEDLDSLERLYGEGELLIV